MAAEQRQCYRQGKSMEGAMSAGALAADRTQKANRNPVEWEQRVNLAACYRLVEHFGWTELIYTHISARVPDEPGHFLLNRFGLLFDEVTASNLIKVDLDGNLVEEPDAPMHKAGFVIHSAIHAGRDDVDCVIHTHSKAGVAVAAMKEGLLPLSPHAQLFFGRVSYHDYEGLAVDIDERQRLIRDLGTNPVMILRNHGLLAVGPSIPLAFSNLFNLQFACETQVLAMAGGAALNLPPAGVPERTAALAIAPEAPFGTEWAGLLRKLDRTDPSYRT
jgi:ribulose-5-phosphate 4-epimerase/fuculose-1-phosphate aldolase